MSCPGYHLDGLQQLSNPSAFHSSNTSKHPICKSCNKPSAISESLYGCRRCLYWLCSSCYKIQQFVFDDLKSNQKPNPPLQYRPRELINTEQESKLINKLITIALSNDNHEWTTQSQTSQFIIQSFKPKSSQNTIIRGKTTNKSSITLQDYQNYLTLGNTIHKSSLEYQTCSQIIIGTNHEIRHDKFYDLNKKTHTRDIQYMLTRFQMPSYHMRDAKYTVIGLITYSLPSTHKLYTKPKKNCQRIFCEPDAKICYQKTSTMQHTNTFTFTRITHSPNWFLMEFDDKSIISKHTMSTFHTQCQSIEHTLHRNEQYLSDTLSNRSESNVSDVFGLDICDISQQPLIPPLISKSTPSPSPIPPSHPPPFVPKSKSIFTFSPKSQQRHSHSQQQKKKTKKVVKQRSNPLSIAAISRSKPLKSRFGSNSKANKPTGFKYKSLRLKNPGNAQKAKHRPYMTLPIGMNRASSVQNIKKVPAFRAPSRPKKSKELDSAEMPSSSATFKRAKSSRFSNNRLGRPAAMSDAAYRIYSPRAPIQQPALAINEDEMKLELDLNDTESVYNHKSPPSNMGSFWNKSPRPKHLSQQRSLSKTPKFSKSPKFWKNDRVEDKPGPNTKRIIKPISVKSKSRAPFIFGMGGSLQNSPVKNDRKSKRKLKDDDSVLSRRAKAGIKQLERTRSFDSADDDTETDGMGGFGSDDSAHSLLTAYNLANKKKKMFNERNYAKSTHVSPLMKGMNINPLDPKIFPCPKSRWVPDKSVKKCQCCDGKFGRKKMFKSGKHHCRKCGHVICHSCGQHKLKGYKVCKKCYNRFKQFANVKYDLYRKTSTKLSDIMDGKNVNEDFFLNIDLLDTLRQESAEYEYFNNDSSETTTDEENELVMNNNRNIPDVESMDQKSAPSILSNMESEDEIKMMQPQSAPAPEEIKQEFKEDEMKKESIWTEEELQKGFAALSFDLFMDSCSMNVGVNRKYLDKFYENGYDDIRMMEFIDEHVLLDEIGFKNKLSMNLVLKKVQWLKESQKEFKEIIVNKLKLPKRYILLFNEKGIVNMEYLVRFAADREILKAHIGITVNKHLDALCLEMKQYQNGTHYKMSMDSTSHKRNVSILLQTPTTPSCQTEGKNNGDFPSIITGKETSRELSITHLIQPGANGRDDTPISHDDLYMTPGDVVQTAGYGIIHDELKLSILSGHITDPDVDDIDPSESSDSESDNDDSPSNSYHLKNLCDLNVVTKGGDYGKVNIHKKKKEKVKKKKTKGFDLSKLLMSRKEIIDGWNGLRKMEYHVLYDKVKDYEVMHEIVKKTWDVLGKLRDNEQLKDFGDSLDLAMINIEYLFGLQVGVDCKEISDYSHLCDFIRDMVIGKIDDGLELKDNKDELHGFIVGCCNVLWSVLQGGYDIWSKEFLLKDEDEVFDKLRMKRMNGSGLKAGNTKVTKCVFPGIFKDKECIVKSVVI